LVGGEHTFGGKVHLPLVPCGTGSRLRHFPFTLGIDFRGGYGCRCSFSRWIVGGLARVELWFISGAKQGSVLRIERPRWSEQSWNMAGIDDRPGERCGEPGLLLRWCNDRRRRSGRCGGCCGRCRRCGWACQREAEGPWAVRPLVERGHCGTTCSRMTASEDTATKVVSRTRLSCVLSPKLLESIPDTK
jgi:hypothetical protein